MKKRFLCYDEENPVGVDKDGVLKTPSWNDMSDKPFDYKATETEVLVLEERVFSYMGLHHGLSIKPVSHPLIVGNKYKVIWDGVEYILECKASVSGSILYIGNTKYSYNILTGDDNDTTDTGEPFFIAYLSSQYSVRSEYGESSHTFGIIAVVEDIKELDEKYIPTSLLDRIVALEVRIEILESDVETLKEASATE